MWNLYEKFWIVQYEMFEMPKFRFWYNGPKSSIPVEKFELIDKLFRKEEIEKYSKRWYKYGIVYLKHQILIFMGLI